MYRRILRRRTVALGNLGGLPAFATTTTLSFIGELFLQQANGLSPIQTGLVFGWLGVVAAVSGSLAPRAIGRFGSGTVLVLGMFVQGLGTVVAATMTRGDSVVVLLLGGTVWIYASLQAIVGYNVTATSGLPDAEQRLATGLATTTQQVGLTVGIPIMSALAASRTNGLVRSGRGRLDALAGGFHLAMGRTRRSRWAARCCWAWRCGGACASADAAV